MTEPTGLIIILHEVLEAIPETEVLKAIPRKWRELPRQIVSVSPIRITQNDYGDTYWPRVFAEQQKQYEKQLKPALDKNPDYDVLYFGRTTIGLAIHLGQFLKSWKKVHVYQANHDTKDWRWPKADAGTPIVEGLPGERFNAPGDVIFRVGTSMPIDHDVTRLNVPSPLREIDLKAPEPGRAIWGSPGQIDQYAGAFRDALDKVHQYLPGVDTVHLFAATTVGVAFRMGQEISPTTHPKVELYEYSGSANPPYEAVFTLNAGLNADLFQLSTKEIRSYSERRQELREHVTDKLEDLRERIAEEPGESWFEALAPKTSVRIFEQSQWRNLPRLDQCKLDWSFFEDEVEHSGLGFHNIYLKVLGERLKTRSQREQAARLTCLHQTILSGAYRIRIERARTLSGFPAVLQEVEYQCDVYALLHEFVRMRSSYKQAAEQMCELIHVLIETLWAFDKFESPDVLETVRVARYLTLYYQQEWLKAHPGLNMHEVMAVLSNRPLLQFRATVKSDGKTHLFDLKGSLHKEAGLALLHNNRIELRENEDEMKMLLTGLRERDGSAVQSVIAGLINEL